MTTFEPYEESLEKYDRNTTTQKVANATQASFRRGTMLICRHCRKNWNDHLGYFVGKGVPGMCLTEENFKETNTQEAL